MTVGGAPNPQSGNMYQNEAFDALMEKALASTGDSAAAPAALALAIAAAVAAMIAQIKLRRRHDSQTQ